MGGQKFQYDESGGTFFYFLLSFLALLLIPGTYYCWPQKRKEDPDKQHNQCHCSGCIKKKKLLQSREPWQGMKELMIKVLIVAGWVMLLLLAYKVSQFDYEFANFDPYEILGVPFGSPQKEIKKAYRKLSLVLHPDKETGDEKAFMKLTKAYQALTDEEARSNWEKYGNPDGPGAMSFGIALPSWIVEKRNSVWVLGLYALVFMVALPTVVGIWWYRSIRYTGDQVLLGTTELYYFMMHSSSLISLKRCLMILGVSLEFDKQHNSEVVERETDCKEVPQLIKQLPNLNEKNRERPLCCLYSIKARALIHAHLSRIPLNPETLDVDRMLVVRKCPYLIQEMVHCAAALVLLAYTRRVPKLLDIHSIEHIMKMSPMIVQALWDNKSPLLQLPHIQEEHLKHFSSKKRRINIKNIKDLALMKSKARRSVFTFLSDEQYEDVMRVMSRMPLIDCVIQSEVIDDEAPTVYTAGAIVTVTVSLRRRNMGAIITSESDEVESNVVEEVEEENEEDDEKSKKPAWQKQQRKQKKGGHKKAPKQKQAVSAPATAPATATATATSSNKDKESPSTAASSNASTESKVTNDKEVQETAGDAAEDSDNEASHSEKEEEEEEPQQEKKENSAEEDNDEEWERFQSKMTKRERALEGRSKISHPVHCPYYPDEKQEYWWVYISDRKSRTLLTSPYHVTGLVDSEEVQLRFTAPRWPGIYTFAVCLRSDSFLGFDQVHEIKLDVKEAPEVPTEHPQWDISDGEEEPEDDAGHISEFTTDEDVEDDEE